ncbi:excalibur calcium-binding domain-containing protein [Sphingomonas sp. CJ99]
MRAIVALLLVASVLGGGMPNRADAHGGGLDKHGCHHDRKGGTGYHCHRGPGPGSTRLAGAAGIAPNPTRSRPQAFANCAAARAAGAAPVRAGDPGYGRHLDRDGDGVGCE